MKKHVRSLFTIFYTSVLLLLVILFISPTRQSWSNDTIKIKFSPEEQAWLERNHTVRIRVGNWPPFMFAQDDFKGISVDYIKKIFSPLGIEYTLVSDKEVPWKEALQHIKNHEVIDLILTAKITEERKQFMAFTDEYLFLPWVIFSRSDSPFIGGINDLAGKTVCVPDGYVMHGLLGKHYPGIILSVIRGPNLEPRCIKALALSEVDAYIGNLAVGSYIVQSEGYSNVKVAAPVPVLIGNHNQAMAVRDDWPELAGIISKSLKSLTPEEHSEIMNKWLSVRYEHGIRPMDIVKWVSGVSGILITILTVSMLWNRRLKREIKERVLAEERLQDSENRYRSLSDAAFEGIIVSDKGTIIDANNAMAAMFGYSIKELIGMKSVDLTGPDYREEVQNKIQSGYEEPYRIDGVKKDGSSFPIEVHGRMFPFMGENVRVTAVRDLTESKKAAEEIKVLRGIIPICASCQKIRDDEGYWNKVADYISRHSEAEFSHGLCSECAQKLYPKHFKKLE